MDDPTLYGAITALAGVVSKLWLDLKAVTRLLSDCEVKHARIEAMFQGLEKQIDANTGARASSGDENAQVSLWLVASLQGKILDAGGRVMPTLGYRATELIGCQVDRIIPPDLRERHEYGLEHVREGGLPRAKAISGEALRKNGTRVPVVVTISTISHAGARCVRAEIFELSSGDEAKDD